MLYQALRLAIILALCVSTVRLAVAIPNGLDSDSATRFLCFAALVSFSSWIEKETVLSSLGPAAPIIGVIAAIPLVRPLAEIPALTAACEACTIAPPTAFPLWATLPVAAHAAVLAIDGFGVSSAFERPIKAIGYMVVLATLALPFLQPATSLVWLVNGLVGLVYIRREERKAEERPRRALPNWQPVPLPL